MIRFPRSIALLCLLAALAGGCRKKPAAKPEERAAAQTETVTRSETAAAPGAPALERNEAAPASAAAPGAPGADPAAAEPLPAAATEGEDPAFVSWFKRHNLDLGNPAMLEEDSDGDGFTNREEFLADTDPRNGQSVPGVHPKLRLQTYTRKDLPFILREVKGESARLERTEGAEKKEETVRMGDTVAGSSLRVTRVRSGRTRDKDGQEYDASRVVLEDSRTKQRMDLVKDMPARSGDTSAVLTSLDGRHQLTVHEGDTFSWPDEPNMTYRVRELRAEQAILEAVGSNKVWTVPAK